ncbi:hypothetical protein ATANTOWER_023375 [Ataeniobius toweri]|uniref:Uncharacterized protein n=1 Tax=Ataeniobius toweri TaxID=208326 RepID=A0ABU7CFI6_9TELE|nr:hypothetical protein [Ataeniobius toweri]
MITLFHPLLFHKMFCPFGGLKVIGGSCSRNRICSSFIISIPSHYCSFWGLYAYALPLLLLAVNKLGLPGLFPNLPNSVTRPPALSLTHTEEKYGDVSCKSHGNNLSSETERGKKKKSNVFWM